MQSSEYALVLTESVRTQELAWVPNLLPVSQPCTWVQAPSPNSGVGT